MSVAISLLQLVEDANFKIEKDRHHENEMKCCTTIFCSSGFDIVSFTLLCREGDFGFGLTILVTGVLLTRKLPTYDQCIVISVTRFGDFLHFGKPFKANGNNYFTRIAHILRQFL